MAEKLNIKDEKRKPLPDRKTPKSKSKKNKPWIVEWRSARKEKHWLYFRNWTKFGKYRTIEEAERVIDIQTRKDKNWEYRLKPRTNK